MEIITTKMRAHGINVVGYAFDGDRNCYSKYTKGFFEKLEKPDRKLTRYTKPWDNIYNNLDYY